PHVAADLDPQLAEQGPGGGAEADPHRGLPGRGTLEDVPQIGGPAVLQRAGEVGVSGTGHLHRARIRSARRPAHSLGPVPPVLVVDPQPQRRPERLAEANAGEDLRGVLLNAHPPTAAVPLLAPREIAVDELRGEREPRGQALEDAEKRRSVTLAGGERPESP